MLKFIVRIICNAEDEKAMEKCEKLIGFLKQDEWFEVIKDSGEKSAGIDDIIVIGFTGENIISAKVCGKKITEDNPEWLSVLVHKAFIDRWIKIRAKGDKPNG